MSATKPLDRKLVPTRSAVLEPLAARWSPRSFLSREPEPDKLRGLFEAARLAPSAHNNQPVRFLVTRQGRGESWGRLLACLSEGNRVWAHRVPVLVLAAVTRRRFSQATASYVAYPHFMHDLGLAVMSLLVQATSCGLHAHPMAAFDPEAARAAFAIPDLYEPGMVIAVGYLGPPEALPEALRAREEGPRTRRPLDETVFEDAWGEPSPLVR